MQDSAIRHLVLCDKQSLAAAAFFESKIQIWSWETSEHLGEFESILDFGGKRLALSPDGKICIAGSWTKGLASHSVPKGRVLWRRRDIRKIQYVTFDYQGREIYCGLETPKVLILDSETGETLDEIPRVAKIFVSQTGRHELIASRGDQYTIRGEDGIEIPAISFALLSAAFSPDSVCLAEPRTGVRCIDLATGNQIWQHETLAANHLAFNTSDQNFYCVAVANTPLRSRSLVRLSSSLPRCERVLALGQCWEDAFSPSGEVLITKDGDVWRTSTGKLLAHFDFPQRDYPDSPRS